MPRKLTAAAVLFIAALGAVCWTQSLMTPASAAPSAPAAPSSPPPGAAPAAPAAPSTPAPPPAPPAGMGPPPDVPVIAFVDSFAAERDSFANLVMEHIAGKENAPAESVFKNIKNLKGMPAARLVRAMNMGFGRNLGVNCDFCHVPNHWADDDKKQKAIARDMMGLVDAINADLVPKMKSLEGERVFIACGTCHQGHHKPARLSSNRPPGDPGNRGPAPGGDGKRHD
jgi:photosynthetic reaction center cytochrome c subunit